MKKPILRCITVHPSKWNEFIAAVVLSKADIKNSYVTVYNVYEKQLSISFACGFTLEFDTLLHLDQFIKSGFLVEAIK